MGFGPWRARCQKQRGSWPTLDLSRSRWPGGPGQRTPHVLSTDARPVEAWPPPSCSLPAFQGNQSRRPEARAFHPPRRERVTGEAMAPEHRCGWCVLTA